MVWNLVICGKGKFVSVFGKVSRWRFSERRRIQSNILTQYLPTLVTYIQASQLIASCLVFSTKLLYALLISPLRVTCPSHLILLSRSLQIKITFLMLFLPYCYSSFFVISLKYLQKYKNTLIPLVVARGLCYKTFSKRRNSRIVQDPLRKQYLSIFECFALFAEILGVVASFSPLSP